MPESKVKSASPYPALTAALGQVPRASGVYLFKDAAGKVLYVGKAVNLRNRLGSYLKTPERHDPKTALMLKKMARVDFLITAGGREALILERNLIKEHHPRYNVMLRDDKNYLCLRLDLQEDFPALRFVRRFSPDGALYFGPYTVAGLARETLKVMKEVFRVRTCKERRLAPRSRPCLEFQLQHCLGPCAGMVNAADYGQAVQEAILFLKGKSRPLLKKLKTDMEQAAAHLDFERAAGLRDRIRAIINTLERQDMARPSFRDQDVLGLAQENGQALILVLLVRGGLVTGSREYFFPELPPDGDLLGAFVKQYYAAGRPLPDEMLLPLEIPDQRLLEALLSEEKGRAAAFAGGAVRRAGPAVGTGGGERPGRHAAAADGPGTRRGSPGPERTAESAPGPRPDRMPGHLHPARRAAGGVADGHGQRRPGQIRLPALPHQRGGGPGRLRHAPGGGAAPLRQGGPGAARPAGGGRRPGAVERGLAGPERAGAGRPGGGGPGQGGGAVQGKEVRDRLFLPGRKNPRFLPANSPGWLLLLRLRDEAHRFAITYHRKRARKEMVESVLDRIPGIGPVRRKRLLQHFPNIEALKAATVEELAAMPGFNRKVAEKLKEWLGGGGEGR